MHVQKLFFPVILGILLIIAVLPPVSAESQSSDLNTASRIGTFTAGTGPAFFSPASFPAPFVPGDSSDLRAVFRSPLSVDSLRLVDYDVSISSPQGSRSISGTPCARSYYQIKRR